MRYGIYVEVHQLGNGRPLKFEEVRVYIFRSSIRRDFMAAWGVCMCVSVSQSVKLLVGLHTFCVVHQFISF